MKIGITYNYPHNEEYGLMVEEIAKVFRKKGYYVVLIPIIENFIERIKEVNFVFNLFTGGKETKQILIPSICDYYGIPYIGSNAYTHAICINKGLTKIILSHYNISTPNFFIVNPGENIPENFNLSFPLFVKPNEEGSGKGIESTSLIMNIENLILRINYIHKKFNEPALIEEFIEGKEISIGVIGNREELEILPLLEIDFSELPDGIEKFYSERVKKEYGDKIRYFCPARIDKDIEEKIKSIAKKTFKILNIRDFMRMDIRVKGNKIYVLDINSLPLLIPNYSDILKMAEAKEYSYKQFIWRIFNIAIERYEKYCKI